MPAIETIHQKLQRIRHSATQLGGTITGEHGVGLAKRRFLPAALGEGRLTLLRQLKRALDPDGILIPGKIFDL